ncbi:hypothetical protein FNV43_RR24675 [Rhamnella rubrinervis]|uniref:Uncharacterized protein n=1 Tax=Rhamnella rubrinervis TaxID=2594499 RepID=A0A8K0GQX5_9ROSA|nr:hypothetical protein FNV43_RR24675 [Rhamnella rubrinervis]
MQSYLKALGLWESILSDADPALLVANPTLNQIRQHEEEKSKKPKDLLPVSVPTPSETFVGFPDRVDLWSKSTLIKVKV